MPRGTNYSEDIQLECISHPDPFHPSHPIKDSEKQSAFYPEIDAFISYKAELRAYKNFQMNITIQPRLDSSACIDISNWSDVGEKLKLLKQINQITTDAINFIESHNLHKLRDKA